MTISECIRKYESLMDEVFCGSTKLSFLRRGEFYDAGNLEKAIKNLIKEKLGDQEAPLIEEKDSCKVYVPDCTPSCQVLQLIWFFFVLFQVRHRHV